MTAEPLPSDPGGDAGGLPVSPVEEALEELRNGRFVVLLDDPGRENEADLVVAAQMCGPERVNFMAKHGRGLICLALEEAAVRRLGLTPMARRNESRHGTAFMVSIEAREGVGTGISAGDRARTIAEAIRPGAGPGALVSPGHVFPLAARDGGVLVRAGHTEAGVDMARLAGLAPAAVICEIMDDDGAMARGGALADYARRHGIKIATIADLIAWRCRRDRIVERVSERPVETRFGAFRLFAYRNRITGMEHAALVAGDPDPGGDTLVRVHALSLLDDLLGVGEAPGAEGGGPLAAALRDIAAAGSGVAVVIRERPGALSRRLDGGGAPGDEIREHGEGAQILSDLGVRRMVLLHGASRSLVGFAGHGIEVVGVRAPGSTVGSSAR